MYLNFIRPRQIFITDSFLGGEFTKFGTEVLNFPNVPPEDRVDPMSRIFPRVNRKIGLKIIPLDVLNDTHIVSLLRSNTSF